MGNGLHGAIRSDHDRDFSKVNGIKGEASATRETDAPSDKSKITGANSSTLGLVNGGSGTAMDVDSEQARTQGGPSSKWPDRMNDLPDEIQHITQDFIPISYLLSRLAQKSHNTLQDKILELMRKPLPVAALNGNSDLHVLGEDNSVENVEKKKLLLNSMQGLHADWVKALIITEWSKKSSQVSKLIDLRWYLREHIDSYQKSVGELIEQKRGLVFASLPSPDLKTALTLLSSGETGWLPELGYVEPPALTAQEQLEWMDNINTLLSIRLSIDDHDKIPYHFRNYAVDSGRVTFSVQGEFEVDLTIADEDFEKQYWFIDVRFLFAPAPESLTDITRHHLESMINDALAAHGLQGCYSACHEMALTSKIAELRRQALDLGRGRWIDTLKVEQLNRAVAIQYWTSRFPPSGSKSWIMVGVHSGKKSNGVADARSTSYLKLRWFRDNKEVKDIEVRLDGEVVSTESILKAVIARHTEHILSTLHAKLLEKPRYAKREASLQLHVSKEDSLDSWLEVQLTHHDKITVRIDPISGQLTLAPLSLTIARGEFQLNSGKDPIEEGVAALDNIRCQYAMEQLSRRCRGHGWTTVRQPVKEDAVRDFVKTREKYKLVWFKRQDWEPQWNVVTRLSLSGDKWFLIELSESSQGLNVKSHVELPFSSGQPNLDDPFFTDLTSFATGIISQITDLKELKSQKKQHTLERVPNQHLSSRMQLPAINVRLSEILPSHSGDSKAKKPWALDFVRISFKGVDTTPTKPGRRLRIIAEAQLNVTDKSKFALLKGRVDRDVLFNRISGAFSLTLREETGRSVMKTLGNKLQQIDRLVDLLDAIRQQHHLVNCESVNLGKVVFTYGDPVEAQNSSGPPRPVLAPGSHSANSQSKRWKVTLALDDGKGTNVTLEEGCPHLRVLDFLTKIVNNSASFMSLPYFLAITLPLHRALDKVSTAWTSESLRGRGAVVVIPNAIDAMIVRFDILPPVRPYGAPQEVPAPPPRFVRLEMKLMTRNSVPWWYIRRSAADNASADDEFNRVLKKIWDGKSDKGTGTWRGVATGALADPHSGIEPCMTAIEEALKTLVGTPPPRAVPAAPMTVGATGPGQQGQAQPAWPRQPNQKQGQAGAPKAKQAVVDLT